MTKEDFQFDDPALKAALKRALSSETAPDELRRRIVALAGGEAISRPLRIWRAVLKGAIAAAILLVIGGILSWEYGIFDRAPTAPHRQLVIQLPPEVAQQMIQRHREMAGLAQPHGLTVSRDNLPQVRQELQQKLGGMAVAVSDLANQGWVFRGARLTGIAEQQAAELLFERGKRRVSIFSLWAPHSCGGYGTGEYSLTSDGHPISGFLRGGELYCVVGSSADGSLTLPEVDRIRQEIERELMPPATMGAACHLPAAMVVR